MSAPNPHQPFQLSPAPPRTLGQPGPSSAPQLVPTKKKKYANVSFHRNMDGHGQPLDSLAPSVNHFIPLCHAEEACSHRLESVGAWRSSSQRLPKESNFNISSMRSSPQTKPGTPCLPVRGGVLKRYGVELAKRRTQNCQFRALLGMESSHGKVRVHSGLRDNDTQQ